MAERIVKKAKEYDRDTIPGDYATLKTPCPNCGGVVKENYRRFACDGRRSAPGGRACDFSITKIPGGRAFEIAEAEAFLRDKKIGPLEGFRSKAGWPFTAELQAGARRRDRQLEARVRLRRRREASGRIGRAGRLLGDSRASAPARSARAASSSTAQLRLRARGRRARHLRLQERQDHPAAAGGARADEQAAGRPARPTCWRTSSPTRRGASSRPPRLRREGRQGRLRVRAARSEDRREEGGDAQGRRIVEEPRVTAFLFSDIEGSTRLWESHAEQMQAGARAARRAVARGRRAPSRQRRQDDRRRPACGIRFRSGRDRGDARDPARARRCRRAKASWRCACAAALHLGRGRAPRQRFLRPGGEPRGACRRRRAWRTDAGDAGDHRRSLRPTAGRRHVASPGCGAVARSGAARSRSARSCIRGCAATFRRCVRSRRRRTTCRSSSARSSAANAS